MSVISSVERSKGPTEPHAMREPIRGIIHVHSHFSRDGLCSIADLAAFARESGFQFVGLTDHVEDLSPPDFEALRRECKEHSDELCVMIPGLEYRCTGEIHILGLGITHDISSDDPVVVASEIRRMGGLAVLAHPGRNGYQCPPELCAALNGIEIWNAGYDGRFVPPLAGIQLLGEAREANSSILGIGGADLHGLHRHPGVVLQLPINGRDGIDTGLVLQYLRTGSFSICGQFVSFSSHAAPHRLGWICLWAFRKMYDFSKAIRNAIDYPPSH